MSYQSENPFINRQAFMKELLDLALIIEEARKPSRIALYVRVEFENMMQAASTVTGVPDMALAIQEYVNHKYWGTTKPDWYAALTGGQNG